MKFQLIIFTVLIAFSVSQEGNPCDAYSGYAQQCSNAASDFSSLVNGDVVGSETACQVLVDTSGSTCNEYCEGQQSTCVAAQDNTNSSCNLDPNHDRQATEHNGCDQSWGNQICVCDVNAGPCRNFSDYEQKCYNTAEDFSSLVNTDVLNSEQACQVLIQNQSTCAAYCESQNAICVAAQDNTDDTCNLDPQHDRQSTDDNGCGQEWNNQICVCEVRRANQQPVQQASNEDPCESYSNFYSECENTSDDFSSLVNTAVLNSPTACQVQVYTEGQTCAQYCSSQNATCIAAQDNVSDTCELDANHDRQDTDGNGCNQSWNNQVCVCDRRSQSLTQNCNLRRNQ